MSSACSWSHGQTDDSRNDNTIEVSSTQVSDLRQDVFKFSFYKDKSN